MTTAVGPQRYILIDRASGEVRQAFIKGDDGFTQVKVSDLRPGDKVIYVGPKDDISAVLNREIEAAGSRRREKIVPALLGSLQTAYFSSLNNSNAERGAIETGGDRCFSPLNNDAARTLAQEGAKYYCGIDGEDQGMLNDPQPKISSIVIHRDENGNVTGADVCNEDGTWRSVTAEELEGLLNSFDGIPEDPESLLPDKEPKQEVKRQRPKRVAGNRNKPKKNDNVTQGAANNMPLSNDGLGDAVEINLDLNQTSPFAQGIEPVVGNNYFSGYASGESSHQSTIRYCSAPEHEGENDEGPSVRDPGYADGIKAADDNGHDRPRASDRDFIEGARVCVSESRQTERESGVSQRYIQSHAGVEVFEPKAGKGPIVANTESGPHRNKSSEGMKFASAQVEGGSAAPSTEKVPGLRSKQDRGSERSGDASNISLSESKDNSRRSGIKLGEKDIYDPTTDPSAVAYFTQHLGGAGASMAAVAGSRDDGANVAGKFKESAEEARGKVGRTASGDSHSNGNDSGEREEEGDEEEMPV